MTIEGSGPPAVRFAPLHERGGRATVPAASAPPSPTRAQLVVLRVRAGSTIPAPPPRARPPAASARPVLRRTGNLLVDTLPFLLAGAAVACLPVAEARTSLAGIGGLGLAGVLSGWAWAALGCAVLACAVEILRSRPRPVLLVGLTGLLILCSTGVPSLTEPAARLPTSWTHAGFIEAIAVTGHLPENIDSRFSWAGFFTQWAWTSEAAGGFTFDGLLRWAPPVIVAVWAIAAYAIAQALLRGSRAPWAAVWLFLGINWIEQDYFSPQATAIVLTLAALACVVGPLAADRADPAGGDWPRPGPTAGRLPVFLQSMVRTSTPLRRPDTSPAQILLVWLVVALCACGITVDHQLTPFALSWQLALLAVAGLFWGRWLIVVLLVVQVSWFVLGASEFWYSQLGLATNDVGNVGGSLVSALFGRLVGDDGQVAVKIGRIALAVATWLLALAGAWIRWRRDRTWILVPIAAVPAGLVFVQSYGGEILLRVMLYGMPFLAVLGAEAIRAVAVRWPRTGRSVLVLGMAALFAVLVVIRGGNDAYVRISPHDIATTRAVLGPTRPFGKVLPLANEGPNRVTRAGDVVQITSTPSCQALTDDLVGCINKEKPDAILVLPTMEAEGVLLDSRPPGWTRVAVKEIVATGQYRIARDEGLTLVLVRTVPR